MNPALVAAAAAETARIYATTCPEHHNPAAVYPQAQTTETADPGQLSTLSTDINTGRKN